MSNGLTHFLLFHVLVIIFKALLQRCTEPHGTEQRDVSLLKAGHVAKYLVEMGFKLTYKILAEVFDFL